MLILVGSSPPPSYMSYPAPEYTPCSPPSIPVNDMPMVFTISKGDLPSNQGDGYQMEAGPSAPPIQMEEITPTTANVEEEWSEINETSKDMLV